MAKKVTITVDGQKIIAKEGDNLLVVCKKNNINIPHLCYYERLLPQGRCRLCVVEIEGGRKPVTSCTTTVTDGMVVKTHSKTLLESRKLSMELILANHDRNCTSCVNNLHCKLQNYADSLGVEEQVFGGGQRKEFDLDFSSHSIVRDNNKCILCGRCYNVCNEIQTVYAIGLQDRGHNSYIAPPLKQNMLESNCVNCGQCVIACPTGALYEKRELQPVIDALNSGKHIIAQTAPSIRAALGESFGMKPGTPVTGKMVAALRRLGFTKVFDTDLAADMTIIEEATEFVKRFKAKKNLPMITTCCPAWVKFGEQFFFEQLNHMSTCRSPQAMMASLIKTYYAKKNKINPKDIIVVDIMPCTAKKFEIRRPEFGGEADYVLTTVELAKLIKLFNIDFLDLPDEEFDNPLGKSTGAGDIFGRSGGVMEAALRSAADMLTGKNLKHVDYHAIRGLETCKEAEVELAGEKIKIAVVHTLGEARKIMEDIRAGESPYHFIEIMACYGGCIGGGGQPRVDDIDEVLPKRAAALNKEDKSKKIRKSHKNPVALKIYKEFIGEPGGKNAHKLLHTKYTKREHL